VSGVVVALGWGVVSPSVGEEVIALTDWYRDGATAEYVAVEARNTAAKPGTVDHGTAAALPLAGLTAWQGLFEHGRLQPGQTVMVNGTGGGVGTYAAQLARRAGCRVIGTGRADAATVAETLGVHEFVDVDAGDGTARLVADASVDLVFDTVGGAILDRSWAALRTGGRLVSVAEPPSPERGRTHGVRAGYFVVQPDRLQLEELSRLVDAGELVPVVGSRVALADGREAFIAKSAGRSPGKTVLELA
jgi:NADPH:quinone reductase-like Zn-dependent oxidoreductase